MTSWQVIMLSIVQVRLQRFTVFNKLFCTLFFLFGSRLACLLEHYQLVEDVFDLLEMFWKNRMKFKQLGHTQSKIKFTSVSIVSIFFLIFCLLISLRALPSSSRWVFSHFSLIMTSSWCKFFISLAISSSALILSSKSTLSKSPLKKKKDLKFTNLSRNTETRIWTGTLFEKLFFYIPFQWRLILELFGQGSWGHVLRCFGRRLQVVHAWYVRIERCHQVLFDQSGYETLCERTKLLTIWHLVIKVRIRLVFLCVVHQAEEVVVVEIVDLAFARHSGCRCRLAIGVDFQSTILLDFRLEVFFSPFDGIVLAQWWHLNNRHTTILIIIRVWKSFAIYFCFDSPCEWLDLKENLTVSNRTSRGMQKQNSRIFRTRQTFLAAIVLEHVDLVFEHFDVSVGDLGTIRFNWIPKHVGYVVAHDWTLRDLGLWRQMSNALQYMTRRISMSTKKGLLAWMTRLAWTWVSNWRVCCVYVSCKAWSASLAVV